MKNIWTQFSVAVITALLFLAMLALNQWIFSELEFVRGVNWIYLPAGARLLCTLLFAEAGVAGLFVVSWLVCNFYFSPMTGCGHLRAASWPRCPLWHLLRSSQMDGARAISQ
jgi:hypothetical protein